MSIQWTLYRLLCCSPPDMEAERLAFDRVNARFSEQVTMPRWILFALASPRPGFDPRLHGPALEANIGFCDFSVHIFGEAAPDPAFVQFTDLALACAADTAKSLRSAVVLFRDPQNASQEMKALRRRLLDNTACQVRDFYNAEEFACLAEKILSDWYAQTQSQHATA